MALQSLALSFFTRAVNLHFIWRREQDEWRKSTKAQGAIKLIVVALCFCCCNVLEKCFVINYNPMKIFNIFS